MRKNLQVETKTGRIALLWIVELDCLKLQPRELRMNLARMAAFAAAAALAAASMNAASAGNERYHSFAKSKKVMEKKVYFDHRITFYCRAEFDDEKRVELPDGFKTPAHEKRSARVEWEHLMPAENFGRSFAEWREGDPEKCVGSSGKLYKGRRCAEKNPEFARMQADLYNLVPAIGSVNAVRSNYNYGLVPGAANTFGTCAMKVAGGRAEPPEYTRGMIARTYLYMADAYPMVRLSSQSVKLMNAWNKMHPVDEWECIRARRIEALQGNENKFVKQACTKAGL